MLEKLERLAAAHIRLAPLAGIATHFVFEREGYAALVERIHDSFGAVGAAGLLTEKGFAALLWRSEGPRFVGRGFDRAATADEVSALRSFQKDLDAALR